MGTILNKLYGYKRKSSIETDLKRSIIFSVGGLLILMFLVWDYVIVTKIRHEYDNALLAKARAMVILTEQENNDVELEFADEFIPEFEQKINPEYFQVWYEDGRILERSNSLTNDDLPQSPSSSLGEIFFDLNLPDGRSGRAIEIIFIPQIDDDDDEDTDKKESTIASEPTQHNMIIRLVVAKEKETLNNLILYIHLSMMASLIILLAIIAWIIKRSVKSGLAPLHSIGEQLKSLDAKLLNHRLSVNDPPAELNPVIEQFNLLLDRVESSFEREQRFSSDVAHELRTPITEIRTLSEVATRWPDDRKLVDSSFSDVLATAISMQHTVNNLLALTQCEKGKIVLEYKEIELVATLQAAWLRIKNEASKRKLSLSLNNQNQYRCHTSPYELEHIINNLFSNAVAYSKEGSIIQANIITNDNYAEIVFINEPENLASDDLPLMFDRLWRKDTARTDEHRVGLGLSLVKAYCDILQLTITPELNNDGQLIMTVGKFYYVDGLTHKKIKIDRIKK